MEFDKVEPVEEASAYSSKKVDKKRTTSESTEE